jgi:RHS repeat-associated protein
MIGYDSGGRITSESRTIGGSGTAVATSFSYNAADRQTTITHQVTGGSALATYIYGYDNANRVTAETDKEGTASFTYDNSDQLTGVTGSRSESYGYDLNGNRNTTGYSTGTENELTASPGVTYSYDNAGNMIGATNTSTHVTQTYAYDYRNRLTGVTAGGTAVATYVYDALDRRIGIKDSGTQTWVVYDGSSPDAEPYADFNGSGTLLTRYLAGPGVVNGAAVDELLARTSSGGTTAWYLPDKLGSVRDIAGSSGTVLDHVVYDSFGNIVTETNATNGDRFKYAGMEYDAAVGIYYDRARYYNSVAGRFLTHDPIGFAGGTPNLYGYVSNEPTASVDASGLSGGQQRPPSAAMPGEMDQYLREMAEYFKSQDSQSRQNALDQLQQRLDEARKEQEAWEGEAEWQRMVLVAMKIDMQNGAEISQEELANQYMYIALAELKCANAIKLQARLLQALYRILDAQGSAQSLMREKMMGVLQENAERLRRYFEGQQEAIGKMSEAADELDKITNAKLKRLEKMLHDLQVQSEINQRYGVQDELYRTGQGPPGVWPPENPDRYPYPPRHSQ